jgi:hypothetical protein
MAIDASPGGANSDSFINVSDANTYFLERLHTDVWDDLDSGEKEKALKWATKILDRLPWAGSKVTDTQALRWPRSSVSDLDGVYFDEAAIPYFLEQATCELGMALAEADRTKDNSAEQLRALVVGPIKLDFNNDYVQDVFPETVKEIISPFLYTSWVSDEMETVRILRA